MALKELYNPESGRMNVAGLISGSGSNLVKIIEHSRRIETEQGRAPYRVVVIFSDNPTSNAVRIGRQYGIDVFVNDLVEFCKKKGKSEKDLEARAEFDANTVALLKPYNVDVAAFAGYMRRATEVLVNSFLGVNVHPADLSVMNGNKRRFTGDNAVRDAILSSEKQLRSTTHIVEMKVDYGRILMISQPLPINLPEDFDPNNKDQVKKVSYNHQSRLKEVGDWIIFPRTLEYIADGGYSQDEKENLYFDDKLIPNGLRLEV